MTSKPKPQPKTSKLRIDSSQRRRFIDKARELGIDESDDPLDHILKRIVKGKPLSMEKRKR